MSLASTQLRYAQSQLRLAMAPGVSRRFMADAVERALDGVNSAVESLESEQDADAELVRLLATPPCTSCGSRSGNGCGVCSAAFCERVGRDWTVDGWTVEEILAREG